MEQIATSMPKEQVVLLLLRCDDVSELLVERCKNLSAMGYLLAISDWQDNDCRSILLPHVSYVMLEVDRLNNQTATLLKPYNCKLVATEANHLIQKSHAQAYGADFYQGLYYLEKKSDTRGKIPLSMHVILALISELNSDGCDTVLEKFFRENPALSLQMLQLVNSAGIGVGKEINSIRHAIMILGRGTIMRWLQVMLYAQDNATEVPSMLMYTALWRAKLMELISTQSDHHGTLAHHDAAFMTGILSLADVLLNETMEEIVASTQLATSISEALLLKTGIAGGLLKLVEALEHARFEEVKTLAHKLNIAIETVATCQQEALWWVNQVADNIQQKN